MLKILKSIYKTQLGFTAIELLVGVALIGLIGAAAATGVAQIFNGSSLSTNRMVTTNNVRNAGDWIARDARMAESVTIVDNCPTIIWHDYDTSDLHTLIYSMSGTDLIRSHQIAANAPTVTTVAQNITAITSGVTNGRLTVTITATVKSTSETRTFTIVPRNSLQ